MRDDLRVSVEKLRKAFRPEEFSFGDTSTVPPVKGFIGNERAVQAIREGLEIDSPEYNIFIITDTGISRKSVLLDFLRAFAEEKTAASGFKLRDLCCVYNFEKPEEPNVLIFNKGVGREFKKCIDGILDGAQESISVILKSDEYSKARDEIEKDTEEKVNAKLRSIEKQIQDAGFRIVLTPAGYAVQPLSRRTRGGQHSLPMTTEEYNSLSEEEKNKLDQNQRVLGKNVEKILHNDVYELRKECQQKIEALEQGLVEDFLKKAFKLLVKEYSDHPEALSFLQGLRGYVLNNINIFRENGVATPLNEHNRNDPFLPFRVNLFVDNSRTEKTPIIFESNPSFGNLFGKVDKKFVQGGYRTDHTHLKAGSLLLADGGYLVLNMLDVLRNPGVWEKLEKTIRYGSLKIEEPLSYFEFIPANLDPKPISVSLKVILVGDQRLYQLLVQRDPEFSAIFKIKAELEFEMPSTPGNQMAYAGFISRCCRERDQLLHFDSSAVAKIFEYGHSLVGNQEELSTEFDKIKDLIVESNYWARKAGSDKVKAEHVQKALESQRLRVNLAESKLQKYIKDGILLIDTSGNKIGQINGLMVLSVGDYSFGLPSRITARTFFGKKGVVSIDREVKMSSPVHGKGVRTFSGYFEGKYGKYKTISFSASICFEQSYDIVDGPSASAAELFCLISSLSELPISQSLAVTGSVNQFGEIQPIGGVNQKIEGFFDVCKERGLTGEQGVIIPHQNIQNLMLREDVVAACGEGKFHIYAIKTVDEGIEILMNLPASVVDKKVRTRLAEMAEDITKK